MCFFFLFKSGIKFNFTPDLKKKELVKGVYLMGHLVEFGIIRGGIFYLTVVN